MKIEDEFGDFIAEAFEMGHSPDTLCHCSGNCRVDPGQNMCHFYPLPSETPDCPIMNEKKFENLKNDLRESLIDWCRDHQNIQVCQGLTNLFDEIEVTYPELYGHHRRSTSRPLITFYYDCFR